MNQSGEKDAAGKQESAAVIILGASGDLTTRKLGPALFSLGRNGLLSASFRLIGVARRDWTDAEFRQRIGAGLEDAEVTQADRFLEKVSYFKGDLSDPEMYLRLRKVLDADASVSQNRLFYLSVKPDLFAPCAQMLHAAGLIHPPHGTPWTRLIIEKPFGRDLDSARALNHQLREVLGESQIFRIDHYLGKETVQNVLAFRFANAVFEPLFNRSYVDHIQITASETLGMEGGRGGYYDQYGALRDMVANHLLQVLSLLLMEPPGSLSAESIHNEKVKVLQALRVDWRDRPERAVCRGQYEAGTGPDGEPVPGYRQEERIDSQSKTETFCALRLTAENWRWAGVPVFIRTGKRLGRKATEAVIQFKTPPLSLFHSLECQGDVCDMSTLQPNRLIFRLQPDEGIFLQMSVKRPSMSFAVEPAVMDFSWSGRWPKKLPEAYERLILDALQGDTTLFARSDEVEASWSVLQPVLDAEEVLPLHAYAPDSRGPAEADRLFRCSDLPSRCLCTEKGRLGGWHDPAPEE